MPASKLTDTQLIVLSAASQREDRGIELPANLRGGAAHKVVGKLIDAGLVEEVQARGELPVWRRDEDNRPMALRITKRGLKALNLEEPRPVDKETSDRVEAAPKSDRGERGAPGERRALPDGGGLSGTAEPADRSASQSRTNSKQAQVVEMLRRPEGTTIAAIMEATGWQQHSVRGFFAGVVRKRLGLTLVSEKVDGERIYRIARADAPKRTKKSAHRAAR